MQHFTAVANYEKSCACWAKGLEAIEFVLNVSIGGRAPMGLNRTDG